MATHEELPWTRTGQTTEAKCANWLKERYGIRSPIIIVPRTEFFQSQISGSYLLFVPHEPSELLDRLARIDLWLNGRLMKEKLGGFLPPYFQFAVGVMDVTWRDVPQEEETAVTELAPICRAELEDRLIDHLQDMAGHPADSEEGVSFRRFLAEFHEEIRFASILSPKLTHLFVKHLPFRWIGGSGNLEEMFSEAIVSGKEVKCYCAWDATDLADDGRRPV